MLSEKWSSIVCTAVGGGGEGFPRDGRKSGNHVFEKRLTPKKGHQKNTHPKTVVFTPFLLLFMFRSIMVAT
jgi:hypothetical protein